MGIVLDYTHRIAPAALLAVRDPLVSGVCRYLKPDSAPAYRITLAEYRELLAAGLDVTLNFEFDQFDWRGGASVGGAHGTLAAAEARALDYPAGGVIIGSCDFDLSHAGWLAYGRGYAAAFAANIRRAGYRPGVYGPWDVLQWVADERIMDAFWQAGMSHAWSGGRNAQPWPGAHLRQMGHKSVAGQDTDWSEIRIPNWGVIDEMTIDVHGDFTGPLTQGTQGYAGQQRDTAISFTWQRVDGIASDVAALKAASIAESTTLAAIQLLLANASGSADNAQVMAAIAAEHEAMRALVVDQHNAEMAALNQAHAEELAGLRAELAAAGG